MKFSRCGGVIAAAGDKAAFPLQKIGSSSAVKCIVASFQRAGIFPIVVISGDEQNEVRYELASSGVVFLQPEDAQTIEQFDSVKVGFSFLQDICEKIVFTPVNTPLFSADSLNALLKAEGQIITPTYNGRGGHPVVVHSKAVPQIIAYSGDEGLRGAMAQAEGKRCRVNVPDEGVAHNLRHSEIEKEKLLRHSGQMLHCAPDLCLKDDRVVFDARTKLLLLLIWKNGSVKTACKQMGISYSKAWNMLNTLEQALDVCLVQRRHGGAKGGKTSLTPRGCSFLHQYQSLNEALIDFTQEKSAAVMAEFGL